MADSSPDQAALNAEFARLRERIVELENEARRDRDLFVDAPVMIAITENRRGVPWIVDCNPLFLSSLGYARDEVLERPLLDLMTVASRAALLGGGYDRALEGNFVAEERHLLTRDGAVLATLLRAVPVRDAAGRVVGTRAMYIDISDRLRAERLARAKDAAEAAARAKSRLLADVGHEIRNPLGGLLGNADLLLETELDTFQTQIAKAVQSCAEDLKVLLDDLLDLSKMEAGRLRLEAIPLELSAIAETVLQLWRPRAEARDLRLEFELDPRLRGARLLGDPLRLRQILLNLLSNAVKFTERGGITLRIDRLDDRPPTAEPQTLAFRIEVRDTGIGIPKAAQDRVFDDYEQAEDSTARRFGGTGLGLGISRRLVELMGGRIGLESTPGQGSTFSIELALPTTSATAECAEDDKLDALARKLDRWLGLTAEPLDERLPNARPTEDPAVR